jgi:hypothetical protein
VTRAVPAAVRDQRALVKRDAVWATRGAFVFAVVCASAAVGLVFGTAFRGGDDLPAAVLWWLLAAMLGIIVGSFAMFAERLSRTLPAGEWPGFYAAYARVAFWHRRRKP